MTDRQAHLIASALIFTALYDGGTNITEQLANAFAYGAELLKRVNAAHELLDKMHGKGE
jgi:hypothetical protein